MSALIRRRIELDPLSFSSANTVRTPGLHLTTVVEDLLFTAGIVKPFKSGEKGGFTEAQLRRYQLQGYAWEDVFSRYLADRLCAGNVYMRLPEIAFNPTTGHAFWVEYDTRTKPPRLLTPIPRGYIICSPDAGVVRPQGLALGEFKWLTKAAKLGCPNYKSEAGCQCGDGGCMGPELEKPGWFWQVKGYMGAFAAAAGEPVNDVEWHVQFPVGEFWGCPPVYESWERHYSDGEIADTWSAVGEHARWRGRDGNHPWSQWV